MLHVISARCVARDLHTVVPWPLDYMHWRQFTAQWGDCRNLTLRLLVQLLFIIEHCWVTAISKAVDRMLVPTHYCCWCWFIAKHCWVTDLSAKVWIGCWYPPTICWMQGCTLSGVAGIPAQCGLTWGMLGHGDVPGYFLPCFCGLFTHWFVRVWFSSKQTVRRFGVMFFRLDSLFYWIFKVLSFL